MNAASIKGNTAMHDAAEAGNLEILQELLKSGAGVCYTFSIHVDSFIVTSKYVKETAEILIFKIWTIFEIKLEFFN